MFVSFLELYTFLFIYFIIINNCFFAAYWIYFIRMR